MFQPTLSFALAVTGSPVRLLDRSLAAHRDVTELFIANDDGAQLGNGNLNAVFIGEHSTALPLTVARGFPVRPGATPVLFSQEHMQKIGDLWVIGFGVGESIRVMMVK